MRRRSILVLALLWQSLVCIHAQSSAPASRRSAESQAAGTHSAQTRKTSKPYTGDLSIFDSPGRSERLQINRVLDILDMAPGTVKKHLHDGRRTLRGRLRVQEDEP